MYTTLTTIQNYLIERFDANKWQVKLGPIEKEGQIEEDLLITLVRIEEETSVKKQNAQLQTENNKRYYANPNVCLNLYILISSHASYEIALQQISETIAYLNSIYHGRNSLSEGKGEGEKPDIRDLNLSIELQSPTAEQWNSLWQTLGGKMVPSVLYKVRMITIEAHPSNKDVKYVKRVFVDDKSPLRYKNEQGMVMNEKEQQELLRVLEAIRKKEVPHLTIQELRFLFEKEVTLDGKEQESLLEGLTKLHEKGDIIFTLKELKHLRQNKIALTGAELSQYFDQEGDSDLTPKEQAMLFEYLTQLYERGCILSEKEKKYINISQIN